MESTRFKASPVDENKQSDTLETPPTVVEDTSSDTKENLSATKDTLLGVHLSALERTSLIRDTLLKKNNKAPETISSIDDTTRETNEDASAAKDTLLKLNALETPSSVKYTISDTRENSPLSKVSLLEGDGSALETSALVKENIPATKNTSKDTSSETKGNTTPSKGAMLEVKYSGKLVENTYEEYDAKPPQSEEDITHHKATFENQDNSNKSHSTDQAKQHQLPKLPCNDSLNFASKMTDNNVDISKNSIFIFSGKKETYERCETISKNSIFIFSGKKETCERYETRTIKRATRMRSNDKPTKICPKERSRIKQHFCDFCSTSAKFVCRVCSYKYCESCRDRLHPNVGPFQQHDITSIYIDIGVPHLDLCNEHGLPNKLNCDFCKCMRCMECASSKCKLHFKGKVSNIDIETEKTTLLSEYEKASSKLSFLGNYREKLEDEKLSIELNALLKREQIRQEFASFHEMLILKENAILEKLDKDMCTRLRYIKETLLTKVEAFEKEESHLANSVIDLIQCKDDQHFIEEYVSAKERCRDVDSLIHDFDGSWAKHSNYPPSFLLDNQLTMLCEKRQLSDSLDVALGHGIVLRFKHTILHIHYGQNLDIFKYLQVPPSAPPSTKLEFLVHIYKDGVLHYSQSVSDPKTFWLNRLGTFCFVPGITYLIKVTAYHTSSTGRELYSKPSGIPTHMLLMYGKKNHHQKDTSTFQRLMDLKDKMAMKVLNLSPESPCS